MAFQHFKKCRIEVMKYMIPYTPLYYLEITTLSVLMSKELLSADLSRALVHINIFL